MGASHTKVGVKGKSEQEECSLLPNMEREEAVPSLLALRAKRLLLAFPALGEE